MKNIKETKRLSLEDFKMNKVESKNEIDKMMGQATAGCHYEPTQTSPGHGVMDKIN